MLLPADTPREWLDTHLPAPGPGDERRWVTVADLVGDDAALLRRTHARMVAEDGTLPAAAAKWLVSWFAGTLAGAAGLVYAAGAAALLVHADLARFRLHPDGWPDHCDVGTASVAVVEGHPWAGRPGVVVVDGEEVLARLAVAAVTDAATPLVEAAHRLAKVGRVSLWAEVVDGLGLPVLHQLDVPGDARVVERLQHLVRAEGHPWRRFPDLRAADTPAGPVYLGRKAGCCLSYRCPPEETDLDERGRAYRERFPQRDGEPRYCSTCPLRDLAGCEERQVFWLQQERER